MSRDNTNIFNSPKTDKGVVNCNHLLQFIFMFVSNPYRVTQWEVCWQLLSTMHPVYKQYNSMKKNFDLEHHFTKSLSTFSSQEAKQNCPYC